MKIVHLIGGGDIGGAKTHVHSLLKNLSESIDVKLVSFRAGQFADEARDMGIDTVVIDGSFSNQLKSLKSLIENEKFDIIHCHGARGNMMGVLMKRYFDIPVVSTVHSDYKLDYMGRPLSNLTFGNINRVALRRVDYRIGVSKPIADMLADRNFPSDKLFEIYNGLDFSQPPGKPNKTEFFKKYGADIREDDIVCGIAARLSPVKDISTLIYAIQKVANVKLVIAGEGELYDELLKQCQRLNISDRVFFIGWVSEMDDFFACVDINLLTSKSETFPYVLTEGARQKCATIASNVGGVPILIDHGVCGFLFESGNVQELSKYISMLADDKVLRDKMGEALYNKAKEEFSIDKTVSTQLLIYNSVINRFKKSKMAKDGVVICGAYGKGNSGDDAILKAIVGEMREIDPDMSICVLSRTPKKTAKTHRVKSVYTFNIPKVIKMMKKSSVYINGGGSLMQDVTSNRSLWFYLYTLMQAKKQGMRVIMYGCGIGPISKEKNRKLAGRVISECAEVITLRESTSKDELTSLGVSTDNVVLAADPAFSLSAADDRRIDSAMLECNIPPRGEYICFSLRPWKNMDKLTDVFSKACEYAYERYGYVPVFVPIEGEYDLAVERAIAGKLSCPYHLLKCVDEPEVLIGVMSRMRAVIGMRLHSLIFATVSGVSLGGVVYDKKVSGFLDYIGENNYVDLEDVSIESLCALIDNCKENPSNVERLKKLERLNVECAKKLF